MKCGSFDDGEDGEHNAVDVAKISEYAAWATLFVGNDNMCKGLAIRGRV